MKNHVLNPVHKTRTELKHDQKFKEMKDGLKKSDKKVKEAKSEEEKKQAADDRKRKLEEVPQYAKSRYQQVLTSTIEQVRSEHPELFDEKGKFTERAITSNGAEGGNWRVKNAVRVPYARSDSAAGKEHASDDQGLDLHHQRGRGEHSKHGRSVHVRMCDDCVTAKHERREADD
jgi:hypothetical protein